MSVGFVYSKRTVTRVSLVGVLLLTSTLVGCSKSRPAWETTYPATGVITFKGKPVVDAELTFYCTDTGVPNSVQPKAKSTEGGKFEVWTYAQGDGAPAGNYKVTAVHNAIAVSKDTIIAKPNDFPEKLGKRDTTDIQIQIVAGKNEIPTIDIK